MRTNRQMSERIARNKRRVNRPKEEDRPSKGRAERQRADKQRQIQYTDRQQANIPKTKDEQIVTETNTKRQQSKGRADRQTQKGRTDSETRFEGVLRTNDVKYKHLNLTSNAHRRIQLPACIGGPEESKRTTNA